MIDPSEFIHVNYWAELAKTKGVLFCSPFELDLLLKEKDGPPVVVSACGDAILCEQDRHFPGMDLSKYVNAVDWGGISRIRGKYPSFQIGPAVQEGRCDPNDRYSLKTDRFTWGTFPEFPKWLQRLYMTNANIEHEKVELLPFGLNDDGPGSSYIREYQGRQKSALLYCNLQWNSERRFEVKRHFQRMKWATYCHEANMPVRDYLEDVSRHKFVLCTIGNGYDQYRIYETLYLGGIPVLEDSPWARRMQAWKIPVLVVNDSTLLTPDFLQKVWAESQTHPWQFDCLTRGYWEQRLSSAC